MKILKTMLYVGVLARGVLGGRFMQTCKNFSWAQNYTANNEDLLVASCKNLDDDYGKPQQQDMNLCLGVDPDTSQLIATDLGSAWNGGHRYKNCTYSWVLSGPTGFGAFDITCVCWAYGLPDVFQTIDLNEVVSNTDGKLTCFNHWCADRGIVQ